MEFFIYLLLIVFVALTPIFGIYLNIIAKEEMLELYKKIIYVRLLIISSLIASIYFLDINILYKIVFSTMLVMLIAINSLYDALSILTEYLLFVLFGLVMALSVNDLGVLLLVSVIIILSNILFSSLKFADYGLANAEKNKSLKKYKGLILSLCVYMIIFFMSAIFFYFII